MHRAWASGLVLLALAAARPAMAADPAPPSPAPISLELNKLEPIPAAAPGQAPGCRAYLVASNPEAGEAVDGMRLDLVLFGTDGVIARRVALDLGPLPPGRTQVRPFDLRDQGCDGIGQVLVNDVLMCRVAGAERTDCLARLHMSSRAAAKLTK